MVRHHEPIGANARSLARILRVEYALYDQRPRPLGADEIQILPRNRRIEILAHPAEEIIKPGPAFQDRRDVAELMRLPAYPDIPRPGRALRRLENTPSGAKQPWRTSEP